MKTGHSVDSQIHRTWPVENCCLCLLLGASCSADSHRHRLWIAVSQAEEGQEAPVPPPAIVPTEMVDPIQEGYKDYVQEEEEREAELESPANVELREKTQHAYEDLSNSELQELIRSTFGEDLENLNGDPARFLSDATILNVADAATVKTKATRRCSKPVCL